MSKSYYHCTLPDNWINILDSGEIRTSGEGLVYVCTTPEDALKFPRIRHPEYDKFIVIKIDVPDDVADTIQETFDHSEQFFKCKCYGIPCSVPVDWFDLYECNLWDVSLK